MQTRGFMHLLWQYLTARPLSKIKFFFLLLNTIEHFCEISILNVSRFHRLFVFWKVLHSFIGFSPISKFLSLTRFYRFHAIMNRVCFHLTFPSFACSSNGNASKYCWEFFGIETKSSQRAFHIFFRRSLTHLEDIVRYS